MPTTRLAAIMFTDIVGYTAMMQRNQAEAMTAVKGYEAVLKARIQVHGGDLLQTYGDGSLSIFDSASAAVLCAREIQEEIRGQVPLRIGIHLGEITIDGDHTFGDGVNIASRVESMGIAGAVLLSSSIRQQIKNRPEFELTSLGKFSFKNVVEPMTVYALANEGFSVPKPEEMKGKGKKVATEKTSPKSWVKMASVGFVAMVVGAAIFWANGMQSSGGSNLLDKDIREAKVAVSVFENFTGDENLDALGYMASEWASSGLRELKVRTVSPEMVRQNKDAIGILPDNPQNKPSFAEITGADYVVTGSYFLKGDSIVLNTRLSSAIDGEEVKTSFPQLIEHIDYKEKLVEDVRQYLLGYWVSAKDQKLPLISPPKYEAYQVYLGCFVNSFWCHEEVLKIDPDFHLARVWLLYASGAWSLDSTHEATSKILEVHLAQLTEFERNIYDYSNFMYSWNYQAAFDALSANYRIDPDDYNIAHQTAYMASSLLNRTDISIERYEKIFEKLNLNGDRIERVSFYHYADALNREGRHQELVDFYDNLSDQHKQKASKQELIIAFYHLGKIERVQKLVEESDQRTIDLLKATYLYAYTFPDSLKNPFGEILSGSLDDFVEYPEFWWRDLMFGDFRAWNVRYLAYYVLKDWEKA
ncbi:MAG: adenylate/guanylate cyclase domain-containing protein, partial [Bacteroidota bacterium]